MRVTHNKPPAAAPIRRPVIHLAAALFTCLAIAPAIPLTIPLAMADEGDHDRARRALQAGEILSLRTIIARVEDDYAGQIIEVELEREDGRWIYEIELLRSGGALVKLELDAGDGTLLGIKGRDIQRTIRSDRRH
ncbi:MAG: PepSY domain-containing protein [Halioglobus sp.]|nr:PepSY domain-containing protein [Halioglobus sp.]